MRPPCGGTGSSNGRQVRLQLQSCGSQASRNLSALARHTAPSCERMEVWLRRRFLHLFALRTRFALNESSCAGRCHQGPPHNVFGGCRPAIAGSRQLEELHASRGDVCLQIPTPARLLPMDASTTDAAKGCRAHCRKQRINFADLRPRAKPPLCAPNPSREAGEQRGRRG